MGLRLRRAHAADAIHRLVVRQSADHAVPHVAAAEDRAHVRRRGSFQRGRATGRTLRTCSTSDFYRPLFLGIAWAASKLRWLQQGRIQLYVLYIALTILVLLVWKLG